MADRRPTPKRGNFRAADIAFLMLAALFSVPAFAASNIHVPGNDTDEPTLYVPVREFITATPTPNSSELDENAAELKPSMETRLPGVSADDQLRFKKRMYRRDI